MDAQVELDRLLAGAGEGFGVDGAAIATREDGTSILTAAVAEPDQGAAAELDAIWRACLLAGALCDAGGVAVRQCRAMMRTPDGRCIETRMRPGVLQPVADRSRAGCADGLADALADRAVRLDLEVETVDVFQVGGVAARLKARTTDPARVCAHAADTIAALFPAEEAGAGWCLSVVTAGHGLVLATARAIATEFGGTLVGRGFDTDLRIGHSLLGPPSGRR